MTCSFCSFSMRRPYRRAGSARQRSRSSGLTPSLGVVIAQVEPLTPARALRGPFDYRLPGEMAGVDVGSMLVIPFGAQRLLGVVVELAAESGVPPDLVRLGLWLAEEYCSTPARGLSLVLPPGAGTGAQRSVGPRRALFAELTDAGRGAAADPGAVPGPRLGGRQRAALAALAGGPLSVAALTRSTGAGHATVRALEARGLVSIERAELRQRPDLAGVGARAGGGARGRRAHGRRCAGRRPPRAAARRDRQRQDRGLPAGGRGDAAARALGD